MEPTNGQARRALHETYTILDSAEKGYAVAAANVNNRALKMLFKTYARQRADFKQELSRQPGMGAKGSNLLVSLAAMIRRGRINIFAALTIGEQKREQVVLKEVLVGEKAALRAYQRALGRPLPLDMKRLIQTRYEQIWDVVKQVGIMRGQDGKQVVVRLFDTQRDLQRALDDLKQAGLDTGAVERITFKEETSAYHAGTRSTLLETILFGAAGGAMWGSVSGTLAGFGVLHLPGLGLQDAPLAVQGFAWAQTAVGAIFAGALVGAILGTFIGWGINGADAYLYNESQKRGQVLLKLETTRARAVEAAQIMARVNREARSEGRHALA